MITDPNFMIACAGQCRKSQPLKDYRRCFGDGTSTTSLRDLWNLLRDDGTYNNYICDTCEKACAFGTAYPCSVTAATHQPRHKTLISIESAHDLGYMDWDE